MTFEIKEGDNLRMLKGIKNSQPNKYYIYSRGGVMYVGLIENGKIIDRTYLSTDIMKQFKDGDIVQVSKSSITRLQMAKFQLALKDLGKDAIPN